MPLIRISLRTGTSASYRRAIADNVYQALRETFDVPENDFFATVSEHAEDQFFFNDHYLDIERSAKLVYLQLTVSNTRTVAQKQALYRRIVERLAKDPGLRPQDVFINLVEVTKENWSFGNGEAQYAAKALADA
jgi:phenylpyruvate tautomerase PptA (4-oxalocrotonate tautomerase family)